jgi:hypothetical protein
MRLSLLILTMTVLFGTALQDDKKKEPFDPFADPKEEMINRAERTEKEKRYSDLKAAAAELKELSQKMSDEVDAGGKDVISARLWTQLDRAEKLVKVMREKAK